MRKLVVVAVVVGALCFAAVAVAAFLPVHQARSVAAGYAKYACHHSPHCHAWGVLKCSRVKRSRVDCKSFNENRDRHGRYTCTTWVEVRKGQDGIRSHPEQPVCFNGWRY
jgi:hypothetical protein